VQDASLDPGGIGALSSLALSGDGLRLCAGNRDGQLMMFRVEDE